jgi:alpha-tubulin suppressor-like RCC1 family protein
MAFIRTACRYLEAARARRLVLPALALCLCALIGAASARAQVLPVRSHAATLKPRPAARRPAETGLVSWWTGNGNALDSVSGNNGTLEGGVTYGPGVGGVSQGFLFNGTNGVVYIPDSASLAISPSISISAWVRVDALPAGLAQILFRGDNRVGYDPYWLGVTAAGLIEFQIGDTSGDSFVIAAPVPMYTPFFVVATLDDPTGEMRMSINEQTVAAATTTIRPLTTLESNQSPGAAIGNTQDPGWANLPFTGLIDEIKLYDIAITNDYPTAPGLWGWGSNYSQQLGLSSVVPNPSLTPVLTEFGGDVIALAASGDLTTLVMQNGTVLSAGSNTNGQLGNGSTGGTSGALVQAVGMSRVVAVAQSCGASHCAVLRADGTVWTWGLNQYGELGNGTTTDSNVPVQVLGSGGAGYLNHVVAIATGTWFTLALRSDGTVWAWGQNNAGQCGSATAPANVTLPNMVAGLPRIAAIAGGGAHSLALACNGTVWEWGNNYEGEAGNGTFDPVPATPHPVPGQVLNISGVVAISCGSFHCMALKGDGTAWCWGWNQYGTLGNGGTANEDLPVQVLDLDDVVSIDGGAYYSLAVDASGNIWTWGEDGSAQEGSGVAGGQSSYPVQVNTLNSPALVSAGAANSIALIPSGQSCSGTITLQGIDPTAAPQLITLTFNPTTGGSSFVLAVPVSPNGDFVLRNVPQGSYTVQIVGEKYLQQDIPVTVGADAVTGLTVTLLAGDLNGDNVVDIDDFSEFAAAFGSAIGEPDWNLTADLNGDGVIDLNDFALLAANYGRTGAP